MPKSDDRFYLMEMSNRPALWGDIGSNIRIRGLLVSCGGPTEELLLLPDARDIGHIRYVRMGPDEWSDFIRRSDDPEILIDPLAKKFHRKLRYAISGAVQQKVWAADGFQCQYCRKVMGQVPMTIDHFIPLELGGKNDHTNYITACSGCNRAKGARHPEEWLKEKYPDDPLLYDILKNNLERRTI